MNRFLVFAWCQYYPNGGMDDFQASFDELEIAEKFTDGLLRYDWYHIYDSEENCIVYEGEYLHE